jgi:hypothetical protein
MADISPQGVVEALAPEWLAGLDGAALEEGRELLAEVVEDWVREADSTPDPHAVLTIQRQELETAGAGRDAAGRLAALRARVLTRRVERLSAATFALGRAIIDGSATDPDAREYGRRLLDEAERLGTALNDAPELRPARRMLSDAVMEALYAVERQAMSPRLARATDAPGGPPNLRAQR